MSMETTNSCKHLKQVAEMSSRVPHNMIMIWSSYHIDMD